MNYGKWGNTQIVDTDWVKHSLNTEVSRPTQTPGIPQGYGFQFWIGFMKNHQYTSPIPSAIGNGGQYIFFWRGMDILLVFTGGNYNRWDIPNDANAAFGEIVSMIKEMQPYLK
jgi:hypothetical protein